MMGFTGAFLGGRLDLLYTPVSLVFMEHVGLV